MGSFCYIQKVEPAPPSILRSHKLSHRWLYYGSRVAEAKWLKTVKGIWLRPSLFCDVKRRRLVIGYGRFGTAYRSHLPRASNLSWKLEVSQRIWLYWRRFFAVFLGTSTVIPGQNLRIYHHRTRLRPFQLASPDHGIILRWLFRK
jgi:hypothetical protein